MATAMAEAKTIAASRIRSALPINSGSSIRPLAISLTRYVPWPQSTMTEANVADGEDDVKDTKLLQVPTRVQ